MALVAVEGNSSNQLAPFGLGMSVNYCYHQIRSYIPSLMPTYEF